MQRRLAVLAVAAVVTGVATAASRPGVGFFWANEIAPLDAAPAELPPAPAEPAPIERAATAAPAGAAPANVVVPADSFAGGALVTPLPSAGVAGAEAIEPAAGAGSSEDAFLRTSLSSFSCGRLLMLSLCGGSGGTSIRAAQPKNARFAKSSSRNVARRLKMQWARRLAAWA